MPMDIVRKNRIKDYWSTDPTVQTPMFSNISTRDRFLSILRILHFPNSENNYGKLYKIFSIVKILKENFYTVPKFMH